VLKGGSLVAPVAAFRILRSAPRGHVAAVPGTLRRPGPERIFSRTQCAERALEVAMIVARIPEPSSKLATTRGLQQETATSSLSSLPGLDKSVEQAHLCRAPDWLLQRQNSVGNALAKRHLSDGSLVLYDVSSTYFEGRRCPLARFGHSRDERSGNPQIVFGLLTAPEGCPVAVEVLTTGADEWTPYPRISRPLRLRPRSGNTGDPTTVAPQVNKLRQRFGLQQSDPGRRPRHAHLGAHPRGSASRRRVCHGSRLSSPFRFSHWSLAAPYSYRCSIHTIWRRFGILVTRASG
jgi:hypothetical protein